MTLVHPEEGISLSPALHREVTTVPQTHSEPVHPQDGATYTCPECKHLSPSMDSLKKHMQSAHPKPNVACKLCDKVYKTVKSLRRHEKTHPGTEANYKGNLPCLHCPWKFSTQTALYWHEVRNHMEMLKTSTCQVCGKQLSDHATLKRHLEAMHSLETASCIICNKTFKSFTNLQRHMNVTHPPDDAVQTCNICNKNFKCSMHLRIHIRTVHAAEAVFSCDICSKEFLSKKYMLKHKKTHIDVKEFPCSICSKLFKSSDDVRKHTKRVHMKTASVRKAAQSIPCDICDKEFSLKKYMLLHKKTHIEVRTFSCEFCDKQFKFASHVRKHTKRMHSNTAETKKNVMFICDICNKSFTVKKNMAKHIKIHYGKRDTPCGICDKLFKTNSDVNRHLKRVHMKGLEKKDNRETITTTKTDTEHTNVEYIDEDLENMEYTENVFASTEYTVKALEISEYTDEVPRSEDYRLETLGSAEYTLKIFRSTSHTEETESSNLRETLVNTQYIKEASEGIELTKEVLLNTDFTQDGPESKDVIKDAIKISEITMDELKNTDKGINSSNISKEETIGSVGHKDIYVGSTMIPGKAITNTDIIKNAIKISDFKMEDLDIAKYDVDSIKTKEEMCANARFKIESLEYSIRNTDLIRVAINKSDFSIEDLGITNKEVETEAFTVDTFGSITYSKEASTDNTSGGANLIKKALRNTDIIREAIEISDFTMEDLGIEEYTENVIRNTETPNNAAMIVQTMECAEETHTNIGFTETLEDIESANVIPESTEFADKVPGNKDIIKEALNISDFTIEDLRTEDCDVITEEVSVEKLKDPNSKITDGAHVTTNFMDGLCSPTCGMQVKDLESAEYKEKAHNNTFNIKSDIERSDFTMEDFELTEYTEDALETDYTMDDFGIEEAKSPSDIELAEVLSTELTDTIGSTYSMEETLRKSEYAKLESAREYKEKTSTDFLEEALNETDYTDTISSGESAEVVPGTLGKCPQVDATELIDKALGNTDIIKEAIDNSEFTMEDLGITEYTDVLSTDYTIDAIGMTECTDTLTNMNLLNCLKCGVDFKNDMDLHTHLCGGEMTLFLDFQDM